MATVYHWKAFEETLAVLTAWTPSTCLIRNPERYQRIPFAQVTDVGIPCRVLQVADPIRSERTSLARWHAQCLPHPSMLPAPFRAQRLSRGQHRPSALRLRPCAGAAQLAAPVKQATAEKFLLHGDAGSRVRHRLPLNCG